MLETPIEINKSKDTLKYKSIVIIEIVVFMFLFLNIFESIFSFGIKMLKKLSEPMPKYTLAIEKGRNLKNRIVSNMLTTPNMLAVILAHV